jgi:hypothetical protein
VRLRRAPCFLLPSHPTSDIRLAPRPLALQEPSSLTLVDVKTIHAGGAAYLNSRVTRCGAVGQRARGVDTEYRRKARKLDELSETRRHNGGSTSAVAGTLHALGKVRGLVFEQYGEASEDVHALLRAAAKAAALSAGRQQGAPSGDAPRLAALFASQLRRAWGLSVVREMARHRLIRLPLIGAPCGTRLSQAVAPVTYATQLDVRPEPLGPPGVSTSQA